jgi:hypothetical protein
MVKCFGLKGHECGVVEGGSISDHSLFHILLRVTKKSGIGFEDAGLGHVHVLGGLEDDIVIDRIVQQHVPGMFPEVVGGRVDPGSETWVISVQKGGRTVGGDRVDKTGSNDVELAVIPILSVLVKAMGGIIDDSGINGV